MIGNINIFFIILFELKDSLKRNIDPWDYCSNNIQKYILFISFYTLVINVFVQYYFCTVLFL